MLPLPRWLLLCKICCCHIFHSRKHAQAGRSLRHLKLSTLRKCLRSVMNPWVWWDSVDAAAVFLNSLKSMWKSPHHPYFCLGISDMSLSCFFLLKVPWGHGKYVKMKGERFTTVLKLGNRTKMSKAWLVVESNKCLVLTYRIFLFCWWLLVADLQGTFSLAELHAGLWMALSAASR